MSEKNEILEEQRRAREEFLKLKRMQSGEIESGPKPSEVAIIPKTPKEKFKNFWFHYKWHSIAIIFITIVLVILISQCSSRVKYDYKIVYFTYTPVLDEHTEILADYIESFANDTNEDGEVNIQIINCSFSNSNAAAQYRNTMLTKLSTIIAADRDTVLFITDEESISFFDKFNTEAGGIFESEPYKLSTSFYENFEKKFSQQLTSDLQISLRKTNGTVLEDDDIALKAYSDAEKLLEIIKTK